MPRGPLPVGVSQIGKAGKGEKGKTEPKGNGKGNSKGKLNKLNKGKGTAKVN